MVIGFDSENRACFVVGGVVFRPVGVKEKGLNLRTNQQSALSSSRGWVVATTCLIISLFATAVKSQDTVSLFSFDAQAIEQWIEQKRADNPDGFDQPRCLRSDAFSSNTSSSCLAQQAVFFLTEVNKRRMIEQEALRKTLQLTDDKRFEAAHRAEIAEATLAKAEIEMAKLDALTNKLATLEARIEQSDQASLDLKDTNAALIDAYKALTEKLRQGLLDSVDSQ